AASVLTRRVLTGGLLAPGAAAVAGAADGQLDAEIGRGLGVPAAGARARTAAVLIGGSGGVRGCGAVGGLLGRSVLCGGRGLLGGCGARPGPTARRLVLRRGLRPRGGVGGSGRGRGAPADRLDQLALAEATGSL